MKEKNEILKDPCFAPLLTRDDAPMSEWGIFGAHDPSMIFADGAYYVFSTGTYGQNYYQIRKSEDLIRWEYVGQAFPWGIRASLSPVLSEMEECGARCCNDTLWAPDIVRGADGKYWLYGCYSAEFGKNHSGIFLAKSERVDGEYSLVSPLVTTGGRWGETPNAIDAQIFYDGHKMYMTYGSFFGGIRILELDPATGLRKDGFTFSQHRAGEISDEEYYGKALVASDDQEGSVVAVKEVPVFSGDVFREEYIPQKVRLFSLVTSADSLFTRYNMRLFTSTKAEQDYMRPPYGARGVKLSSSFSWKRDAGDGSVGYDFFASGHCDLFETPDGRDLIVYHDRTPSGGRFHYLFLSLYAYNVRGEIVMSPNRYAGERLRPIGFGELAGQKFDYIALGEENDKTVYAKQGLEFQENGALAVGGRVRGEWKLYGEYFVSFTLDGEIYHGAAMPAWIEREHRGGITVSARGENGLPFFLNLAR